MYTHKANVSNVCYVHYHMYVAIITYAFFLHL